ncbi:MAG: sigma-70 family RNA polymerase sigma factor [Deltaproteobacteria bacterium]|nr:sigma-70 family RNA polymerase sigma factor [Deltaproteobacteria bacterium]
MVLSLSPDSVLRLRRGEEAAFDEIYEAYRARIFTFLLRLTGRRALAEELVQETFIRLVQHRDRLREDTQIGAWLYRVARNLALSQRRRRALESTFGLDFLFQAADRVTPFDHVFGNELEGLVERALAKLGPKNLEVAWLVFVEGFSQEAVCTILDVRPEALRKRLSRVRAELKLALEPSPEPLLGSRPVREDLDHE